MERRRCGQLAALAVAVCVGFATCRVVAQTESAVPASPSAAAGSGRVLFHESGCIYCHEWNGEGGHKGPALTHVRVRLNGEQIRHQIVDGGGAMPSFQDALTAQQVDALVLFLSTSETSAGHKP